MPTTMNVWVANAKVSARATNSGAWIVEVTVGGDCVNLFGTREEVLLGFIQDMEIAVRGVEPFPLVAHGPIDLSDEYPRATGRIVECEAGPDDEPPIDEHREQGRYDRTVETDSPR